MDDRLGLLLELDRHLSLFARRSTVADFFGVFSNGRLLINF